MYFSEYQGIDGGALLFSELVTDSYYNFYTPDGSVSHRGLAPAVKKEFTRRHRTPAVYLTPLSPRDYATTGGTVWARDAWLVGDVSTLDAAVRPGGVTVAVIGADHKDAYIETFAAAYSGDDPADPYGQLDEGYLKALDGSFSTGVAGYRKYYLLATADGAAVGVAVLFTRGGLAGVYGVGTRPGWRQRGVGTTLMAAMTEMSRRDGAGWIMLQTEEGSAVQRWYRKLGYQDAFTATYLTFDTDVRVGSNRSQSRRQSASNPCE
jgi:ribosomal protein S18 acetylase RimI-like enzyme